MTSTHSDRVPVHRRNRERARIGATGDESGGGGGGGWTASGDEPAAGAVTGGESVACDFRSSRFARVVMIAVMVAEVIDAVAPMIDTIMVAIPGSIWTPNRVQILLIFRSVG